MSQKGSNLRAAPGAITPAIVERLINILPPEWTPAEPVRVHASQTTREKAAAKAEERRQRASEVADRRQAMRLEKQEARAKAIAQRVQSRVEVRVRASKPKPAKAAIKPVVAITEKLVAPVPQRSEPKPFVAPIRPEAYMRLILDAKAFLRSKGYSVAQANTHYASIPECWVSGYRYKFTNEELVELARSRGFAG